MKYPNLNEEKKLWKRGYKWVAGLDEAGRGPLAGPVVAAAVVLINQKSKIKNQRYKSKIKNLFKEIKDSKKLTPKKREEFYKILTNHPQIKWGIGIVSEKVIDKINIKNAAELAMEKAVINLKSKCQNPNVKTNSKSKFQNSKIDYLIIDGNHLENYKLKTINYKLITKADEKVFSCAAASILAKVTRDRMMLKYDKKYPHYGFKKNKGYPTRLHFLKIKKYGPCKIHRRSFSWKKD